MASGDKLVDGVPLQLSHAEQGVDLFAAVSGFTYQGETHGTGINSPSGATLWVDAEIRVASQTKANVPDFDVEKQYKLTIEEV